MTDIVNNIVSNHSCILNTLFNGLFLVHSSNLNDLSNEIRNSLFPNIPTFIGHLISTIVILIVIARLGYKPFRDSQRKKHEYIRKQIDDVNEKFINATITEKKAKKTLENATKQANSILQDSVTKGRIEKNKLIKGGEVRVSDMIQNAENYIKLTKEDFKQKKNKEILEISKKVSEKILNEKLNKKSDEILINDFMKYIIENKKDNDK